MSTNTYKESEEKEELKEVEVKPKKKKKKEYKVFKGIQSILDGTILSGDRFIKGLPFLFFITFLGILYIANSYYAEKKFIEIEKVKKNLKELRSENITTKSKLMLYSRQSEVIKRINAFGIKESLLSPHKLITESDTSNNKVKRD